MIDEETPPKLVSDLHNNRHTHIYTLDLIDGKILCKKKTELFEISLSSLKEELEHLLKNVEQFHKLVSSPLFEFMM